MLKILGLTTRARLRKLMKIYKTPSLHYFGFLSISGIVKPKKLYMNQIYLSFEYMLDISRDGVAKPIKDMKRNKALTIDNIIPGLIKGGGGEYLKIMFNKCLQEGDEMSHDEKKCHPLDLGNNRPISLLSQVYNVLTKIITSGKMKKCYKKQPSYYKTF